MAMRYQQIIPEDDVKPLHRGPFPVLVAIAIACVWAIIMLRNLPPDDEPAAWVTMSVETFEAEGCPAGYGDPAFSGDAVQCVRVKPITFFQQ